MNHEEAIAWLFSLHRFGMKLGLDNIRALMETLGRPQERFAPVLIAGTNGKGSTAAMLHSILLAAGVPSGLYTSPHLVRTEERIRIGESEIDPSDLTGILIAIRSRIDRLLVRKEIQAHPTFFEVITAAAFVAFARAGVKVAVLEVGLGGRLDATNVASPILSVITSIDYDHEEQLGSSLASIAREKSGILRRGVHALVGDVGSDALKTIRLEAKKVGARLVHARDGCRMGALRATSPLSPPVFSLVTPVREYAELSCPLPGEHQRANVLLAIRAAELLSELDGPAGSVGSVGSAGPIGAIQPAAIVRGVASTRWPGRLEWVDGRPSILLDGAHNPAGCRALAEYVRTLGTPPVLLFAAMRDKQVDEMLSILLPRVSAAVFTRPPMSRAADPETLLEAAGRIGRGLGLTVSRSGEIASLHNPAESLMDAPADPYFADADVASSLERARRLAGPAGAVLVAGSLFLIGAVKEVLMGLPVRAGEGA